MIYDVLHTDPGNDELKFTADSGELEVAIAQPTVDGVPFVNANSARWFLAGDNILLQTLTVNLPFGFGQGTGIHHLGMVWTGEDGNSAIIHEFADNSDIDLPNVCEGLVFPGNGLLVKVPTTKPRWLLNLTVANLNVSMVNLPAALDAQVLRATYFATVVHTQPMQSGS